MRLMWLRICLVALCIARVTTFTEVFSITRDEFDNSYYAGNQESNFFIGKRDQSCAVDWASTDGSTTGDNDNDENSEILYSAIVGSDGLLYAAGSTRGNFTSPTDEAPNLDAAVVVYDPSSGRALRQRQYDVVSGFDNVGRAIVQKPDGSLLVAVYGSPPNVDNSAVYQTLLMEVNQVTLDIENTYPLSVTITGSFPVVGGPKILDFMYDDVSNSIVAIGHILGRGILWRYSLASGVVTAQAEWGTIFGSYQISSFATDGAGAFFVVGSSQERVLGNTDLSTTISSQFHAYVIRYDGLVDTQTSATWVRQLDAVGSSQSGMDVAIDPVTGELIVIGAFDADFEVTDSKTSQSFQVEAITNNGLTDVYVWVLEPVEGNYTDVKISALASTVSEDRANAVQVMSDRRVDIGGVINDGIDENPLVCDESKVVRPSPSASISPSPSITLTSSPSASASISGSVTPSPSASVTPSPAISQSSSASSTPSPSRVLTVTASPTISTSPTISASQLFTAVPTKSGITSAAPPSAFSQSPSVTLESTVGETSETPVASALPTVTPFSAPSMLFTTNPAAIQSFGVPASATVSELPPVASALVASPPAVQSDSPSFAPIFNTTPGISEGELSPLGTPYFSEEVVWTMPLTISSIQPLLHESDSPIAFSVWQSVEFSKVSIPGESLPPSIFVVPPSPQFMISPSALVSPEASFLPSLLTIPSPSFKPEASSSPDGIWMSSGNLYEALPSAEIEFSPGKDFYSLGPFAYESPLFPSQLTIFTKSPSENFANSPGLSPSLELFQSLGLGSPEAFPKLSLVPSPEVSLENNNQAAVSSTEAITSEPHELDDVEPSHSFTIAPEDTQDISLPKTTLSVEASLTAGDVLSGSSEADFDVVQKPASSAESTNLLEETRTTEPHSTPESRLMVSSEVDVVPSQPLEPGKESTYSPVTTFPEQGLPIPESSRRWSPEFEIYKSQEPGPGDIKFSEDPISAEPGPAVGYTSTESPEIYLEPSELPKMSGDLTLEADSSSAASPSEEVGVWSGSPLSGSPQAEPRPVQGDVLSKSPDIDLVPSQLPETVNGGDLVTRAPSEGSPLLPIVSAIWSVEIGSDVSEKPVPSSFATRFPPEATPPELESILESQPSRSFDFELVPSQLPKPSFDGDYLATMAPSMEAKPSPEESMNRLHDINTEVSQKVEPSNSDADFPRETTAGKPSLTPGHEPHTSPEFSTGPSISSRPNLEGDSLPEETSAAEPSLAFKGMPRESVEIRLNASPFAPLDENLLPTPDASRGPGFLLSRKPSESPEADIEAFESASPIWGAIGSPTKSYQSPNPPLWSASAESSQFDLSVSEEPSPTEVIISPIFPLSTLIATPPTPDSFGNENLPSLLPSSESLEASLQPLELVSVKPSPSSLPRSMESSLQPLEQISMGPSRIPSSEFPEVSLQPVELSSMEPSLLPSLRFMESSPQPLEQISMEPSRLPSSEFPEASVQPIVLSSMEPSLLPSLRFMESSPQSPEQVSLEPSLQPIELSSTEPSLLPSLRIMESSPQPLEQISMELSPLPSSKYLEISLQPAELVSMESSPLPSSRFVESSLQPLELTSMEPSPRIITSESGTSTPQSEWDASPSSTDRPPEEGSSLVPSDAPVPSSVDSSGLSTDLDGNGTFEPSPAFPRKTPLVLLEVSYLPLPLLETSQLPMSRESQEPLFTLTESVIPIISPSFPYISEISLGPSIETFPSIVELPVRPSPTTGIEDVFDPSPKPTYEHNLPFPLLEDISPEETIELIMYSSIIPTDEALSQSSSEESDSLYLPSPQSSLDKPVIGTPEVTVSVESNFTTTEPIENATILPSAAVSLTSSQTPVVTRSMDLIPSATSEIPIPAISASALATPDDLILPTNFPYLPSGAPDASVLPSSAPLSASPPSRTETYILPFDSPLPSAEEGEPIVARSPLSSPSDSGVADIFPSPSTSTTVTSPTSSPPLVFPSASINSWTPTPSQTGNGNIVDLQPSPTTSFSTVVSTSSSANPSLLQSILPSTSLLPSLSNPPSARATTSITTSTSPSSLLAISASSEASATAIQPTASQLPPSPSLESSSEPLLSAHISASPSITDVFTSSSGIAEPPVLIPASATVEVFYTPSVTLVDISLELKPSPITTTPEMLTIPPPTTAETLYTPVITRGEVILEVEPSAIVITPQTTVSATASASFSSDNPFLLLSPSPSSLPVASSQSSSSTFSPSLSPSSEQNPDIVSSPSLFPPVISSVTPSAGSISLPASQFSASNSISALMSASAVSPSLETTPDTVVSPSTLPRPPPSASDTSSPSETIVEEPSLVPNSPSAGTETATLLPSRSAVASKTFTTKPEEPINPLSGSANPTSSTLRSLSPAPISPLLSPIVSSTITVSPAALITPEYEKQKALETSEASEASGTPETLNVPKAPEISETPKVPEASKAVETLEALETLKALETPAATLTPEVSELPVSSDILEPLESLEPFDTPETSHSPDSSPSSTATSPPSASISPSMSILPSSLGSSSPSPSPPRSIPPSSSVGPIVSSSPSSSGSPVSAGTPTVSPAAATSSPSPMMTPDVSPFAVPSFSCNETEFVHDVSELLPTENFQRVEMGIQVAGANVTNSCGLTNEFIERFVNLSAINTQSNAALWFITLVEDGPAVFSSSSSSSLVTIEIDDTSAVNDTSDASPTPSNTPGDRQLFPGSAVFYVTAYLEALSVGLAQGSYVEYIDSQNIVRRMKELGYDDIEWTGMIKAPKVLDARTDEESGPKGGGISAGAVGAISAIAVMIAGAAILVFKDSGIVARTGNAKAPLADMV